MLFYPSGYVKPVRLQGAFVSDAEVQRVVDFWKEQANGNNYDDSISEYLSSQPEENEELPDSSGKELRDSYFELWRVRRSRHYWCRRRYKTTESPGNRDGTGKPFEKYIN